MEFAGERFRIPAGVPESPEWQRLEARLLALKGSNVELHLNVMPGHMPQYRCVGGIVFTAQRARLRIGFISEPAPASH